METKTCRFYGGPLDGKLIEVPMLPNYKPLVAVDQIVPMSGPLPPIMKMVRPFKEIWTYDRQEPETGELWEFSYVGQKIATGGPKCKSCNGKGYIEG